MEIEDEGDLMNMEMDMILDDLQVELGDTFMPLLISLLVYFFPLLLVGLWSGLQLCRDQTFFNFSLSSRNTGILLGSLSITAALFGGGMAHVETSRYDGLVAGVQPLAAFVGLLLSALFFAGKLRRGNHLTVFDPIGDTYGRCVEGFLSLLSILGEILLCASLLSYVGAGLNLMAGYYETVTMPVVVCILLVYSLLGGMTTISYTHCYQVSVILIGLTISLAMSFQNPDVLNIQSTKDRWLKPVPELAFIGSHLDAWFVTIASTATWQPLYQRILCGKSYKSSLSMTLIAGAMFLLLHVPVAMLGIVGNSVDFAAMNTTSGEFYHGSSTLTMTILVDYLCPLWASLLGLLAMIAAIVSTLDSVLHASATVLVNNVYASIVPMSSDKHRLFATRTAILLLAVAILLPAISLTTLFGVMYFVFDFMCILIFPHFVMALRWPHFVNTYGSLASIATGITLRILIGEPLLNIPAMIKIPLNGSYNSYYTLPLRIGITLISWLVLLMVSLLTRCIFTRGHASMRADVLKCYNTGRPQSMEFDEIAPRRNVQDNGFIYA